MGEQSHVSMYQMRAVAASLVTSLVDVLPVIFSQPSEIGESAPTVRRMTPGEVATLLRVIRKEDPTGLALVHMRDIVAAAGGENDDGQQRRQQQEGRPRQAPAAVPAVVQRVQTTTCQPSPLDAIAVDDEIDRLRADDWPGVTEETNEEVVPDDWPGVTEETNEEVVPIGVTTASIQSDSRNLNVAGVVQSAIATLSTTGSVQLDDISGSEAMDVEKKGQDTVSRSPTGSRPTGLDGSDNRQTPASGRGAHEAIASNDKKDTDTGRRRRKALSSTSDSDRTRSIHMYSVGDLAHLVRAAVGRDVEQAESFFDRYDKDMDGVLSGEEFTTAIRCALNQDLKERELEGLYELMANSREQLLLCDVRDFFCSPAVGKHQKFTVPSANIITSIAFSANQKFVAFGGMDCVVKMYVLEDAQLVTNKRVEKQIASIAVTSTGDGIGIGCVGGAVKWMKSHSGSIEYEWDHANDVHSVAIDKTDSVLAIGGADCAVTLYSIKTGKKMYRFMDSSAISAVALSEQTTFVLELEDGRRMTTSDLNDIRFEGRQELDVAQQIREIREPQKFSSVVLEGTILQRSDELGEVNVWGALDQVLNSVRALVVVTLLVIFSITVFLLNNYGLISDHDAEVVDVLVTLLFIAEFAFRLRCYVYVEHGVLSFFNFGKHPLNVVDFCVVVVDLALLAAASITNMGSTGGLSAFVRGVRLVRLVRVLRIFRIAEHVVRNKGRAPEFDIMLKNGTLMRKIPEPRLLSLDAKAQVEYYTRRQLRQHTQSTADGLEHKDSASLMGFVRKASTRGSTSPSQSTRKISCDAISNEDDGARERVAREALKKFQRFEEGTPIEVRVTARIFSKQTAKYLALGGESQRVVVWQYDMTAEQVASCRSMPFEDMDQQSKYMRHESMSRSGNRVSLSVGKDGKMVSREKQARMKHAHPFTQTVNCVSLSADGRRLAGGDANGVVIVYDLDSRCELFRWTDPSQILGVDLSMSGDRLGICGDSKTARMFHVPTGAPIFERVTKDRLRSVRVSSDGRMMATGFEGQLHVSYVDHGARYHSFELGETIRSISTDFSGLIVAMGCEDGRVAVYDLGLEGRIEPIWVVNHSKKVWVVAVSPNGFFVAAGDYANHVCVYEARSGIPVWTKTSWDGKGAPFTWGLSWSGDSSVLAIGRWDTYAYLVDAKNWACVASVKRGDRVYCVSLDHLGQRVAVGGHDRIASVYSISQEKSSAKWQVKDIFSVELDASIYSIALSMDGRQLAAGCVDNAVCCYAVNKRVFTSRIIHGGLVQSIAFSHDAKHLAIGGEHESVDVWRLDDQASPEQVLALPRNGSVASVAFSQVSLCFVSGSLATIYGMGGRECEWTDRPSFEVIADMITHKNALTTTLKKHPAMLNSTNPVSGESLLQYIVRGQHMERVELMLSANCRLGLVMDAKGHTALKTALLFRQKQVVKKLLYTIIKNINEHPSALEPFMRHRVEIAHQYPDTFLEFCKTIHLIEEEKLAPPGRNTALLQSATNFLSVGSYDRSPINLWSQVLEAGNQKKIRTGDNAQVRQDPEPRARKHRLSNTARASAGSGAEAAALQRIMVAALRVPLEGAVAVSHGGVARPETTLLYLISRAAMNQDDFTVFNSLVVTGCLQFKWESYAAVVFRAICAVEVMHLFFVCLFSYMSVRYPASTVWLVAVGCITFASSLLFLAFESRQLLVDGKSSYFQDPWKYLKITAPGVQVVVVTLCLSRSPALNSVAAWSVLLSFFNLISFARGFELSAPLVRMIAKMMADVRYFFMLMAFILGGFAMAFSVAIPSETPMTWFFWMVNSALYGYSDIITMNLIPMKSVGDLGVVLLFEMLMCLVMLLMLNLLIAIMNSAYNVVRVTAMLEVRNEKASIIHDVERFWMPWLLKRFDLNVEELFPRWLHLLVPTALKEMHEQTIAQPLSSSGTVAETRVGAAFLQSSTATQSTDAHSATFSTEVSQPSSASKGNDGRVEETEDVPSQHQMLQLFGDLMRGELVYEKITKIHAKEALDNGVLETVVQAVVQTSKLYEKGDMIICGAEGERYTMQAMAFAARYDRVNFEPATNPALDAGGFKLYKATGKIWAHLVSDDDIAQRLVAGQFIAAWGSPIAVEAGDYLAMPFPGGGEMYRIKKDEFSQTYQPVSDVPSPP